jgi:hypothetical protein
LVAAVEVNEGFNNNTTEIQTSLIVVERGALGTTEVGGLDDDWLGLEHAEG